MGIDCPDIRRIVHWGMPTTLEEYLQETGRAGRDGQASIAILYRANNATARSLLYESNTLRCRNVGLK